MFYIPYNSKSQRQRSDIYICILFAFFSFIVYHMRLVIVSYIIQQDFFSSILQIIVHLLTPTSHCIFLTTLSPLATTCWVVVWSYSTAKGRWDQSHFVRCFLEGLRQAHAKPLNYGKLADIEQEEKEAPGKFLDRLRGALRRFTEIDPESEEGRVILKNRFLTQLAPDTPRKLLK